MTVRIVERKSETGIVADDGELFLNGLFCNREISFCAADLGCKRCKRPVQFYTEPGVPFMHM